MILYTYIRLYDALIIHLHLHLYIYHLMDKK